MNETPEKPGKAARKSEPSRRNRRSGKRPALRREIAPQARGSLESYRETPSRAENSGGCTRRCGGKSFRKHGGSGESGAEIRIEPPESEKRETSGAAAGNRSASTGGAGKATAKPLRALKTATGVLGATAFLFVAVCFIVILVQLFSGREPSLFGYRFYYILTDSMRPTYEPGDVVLSKGFPDETSKLSIKIGDTVTFFGNTGDQNGKIITHRVIKAPYFDEASGKYFLTTKGDREGAPEDPPVPLENVRAAAIGKSRVVGFLYRAIRTPVGYVFLIVVPVCVLIALLILKMIADFRKKKKEDVAERERERLERLKKEAVEEFLKQKKNR